MEARDSLDARFTYKLWIEYSLVQVEKEGNYWSKEFNKCLREEIERANHLEKGFEQSSLIKIGRRDILELKEKFEGIISSKQSAIEH